MCENLADTGPKDVELMSLNLEVHHDIAALPASRLENRILGQNTHYIPGLCIQYVRGGRKQHGNLGAPIRV